MKSLFILIMLFASMALQAEPVVVCRKQAKPKPQIVKFDGIIISIKESGSGNYRQKEEFTIRLKNGRVVTLTGECRQE